MNGMCAIHWNLAEKKQWISDYIPLSLKQFVQMRDLAHLSKLTGSNPSFLC